MPRDLREYSREFYEKIDREGLSSAAVVIPILKTLLSGSERVLDIGCGHGAWLSVFLKMGAKEVLGLDGSWIERACLLISSENFRVADIAALREAPGKFDLALCLEVAEHLPRSASLRLVEVLTQSAPAVLFSAAIPGQGGTSHINEQWPGFYEKLFQRVGFERLDSIRPQIWQDSRVAWYFQQNLMLYVDREIVKSSERLSEELQKTYESPLTLVHPRSLCPQRSVIACLRTLSDFVISSIRRGLSAVFLKDIF